MLTVKRITTLVLMFTAGYASWSMYHYFFDNHIPSLIIKGIEHHYFYKGTLKAYMLGADNYKLNDISICLDEKPLVRGKKINAKKCEEPIIINTQELADGKHTLSVCLTNGIYRSKTIEKSIDFFIDNQPLHASFAEENREHKIYQGKTLHLMFQVNKPIKTAYVETLNNNYPCFSETKQPNLYECFIPISCEEKPQEHLVQIHIIDIVGNAIKLDSVYEIIHSPFKKQQLTINNEKVKKEKELGLNNEIMEKKLLELACKSPQKKLWHGAFFAPTEIQRISTEFGAIRVTKEKGRYLHKAVDIVNLPKSVIWAPQDGIVVLKDRFSLSGNTVALDHGCGILSLFFHLDDFAEKLEIGSLIKQGNPIGTLGSTGYASGPHLHWEMRIANIPVDPLQWTQQNF